MAFSTDTKSRSWMVTVQIANMETLGMIKEEYEKPEILADKLINHWQNSGKDRIAAVAVCVSANGLYHAHLALYGNSTTLHYVSELFGKSHVEPQLGKKEQLKDYLNKEGIYAEKGEQVLYTKNIEEIKDAQGNRSDLAEIERLLNEGYTPAKIFVESFRYMRYEKMIKTAYINKRIKETPLIKKMHNEYHFGESGTGKSYTYIQLCEKYGEDQVYLCSDYENSGSAGFDYYLDNPAKVIVLDEFRGNMKYSALLSILDVYSRNQQHCRFRNTFSLWESVYICSVLPPEEVYSRMVGEHDRRSDPFSQFLRRLDKIVYHYIENGEYKTYEKPASEYHSAYQMQCEAQGVPPLYPALYSGNMDDFRELTSYSKISAAAPVPAVATPPTPQSPTTPIPQSSPTSIEAKAGAPTPPETAGETSAPTLSQTE